MMINKLCRFILFKALGWRMIGDVPRKLDKYLFVAIPHTSNWDFVYAWLTLRALNLDVKIFIKDTYFIWPLRGFCRFFGVAPVNRRERTNFVDAISNEFDTTDRLVALLAPEGTRKYQAKLKSGYYYLAQKASVPIVLAGPNYEDKTFTISPPRDAMPTLEEDLADLVSFSKKRGARRPEKSFSEDS